MRLLFTISLFTVSLFLIGEGQQQIPSEPSKGTNQPNWVDLMNEENPDPGKVLDAYETFYEQNEFIKNQNTQQFKRWLRSLDRDVIGVETNQISLEESRNRIREYQNRIQNRPQRGPGSAWSSLGPFDWDHDAASRSYAPGAGHVYTLEQSAADPNLLYAGTATAGLWKSTDKGGSWNLVTRDIIVNGIVAVELDHSNTNIAYFVGSGDVYKTIDGGVNWNNIGDPAFTALSHNCKDLVMHPSNPSILWLCSNQGLFRTIDGGANWTQLMTGIFQEMEFHPTNSNIAYCTRNNVDVTEFYKSTDAGISWVQKPNGWPAPTSPDHQRRTEIATTPAAPNNVYALATGSESGGSGLYGIYVSTDAGENWTFRCCGPQPAGAPSLTNINMMGWSDVGTDDGGQYYYDLALDVSDTDPNKIHVGGVNHWVSTDGGFTFTCPAKWSHPAKPEYVHADIHDIRFYGNDLWVSGDGGIFYSSDGGTTMTRKLNGIEATDFWGFGAGFSDGEVMLGGTYHNGTLLKDNNVYLNDWICTQGGDNYRGFVNFGDSRKVYHDGGGKELPGDRTVAIGGFPFTKNPNATYTTGRSSEITFDPRCYNHIYSGQGTSLWKSENGGATFNQVYDFAEEIRAIEVAWTNPDVIYASTDAGWWAVKKLWRSTDAGSSWTDITPATGIINGSTWVPYDIAVSSSDENDLWIARTSMYSNSPGGLQGYQVFKSTDAGNSWTNWSTPMLNGEYPTNIVHQRGTDGGVYIGTRRAVYYRNNSMPDWAFFNNNLPATTSSVKVIPYYRGEKLRNGTNRSVYEVDFYEPSAPSAQIAADRLVSYCTRDTVYFVDHSALSDNGASWNWSFPGGSPSSSTLREPKVVYSAAGTYDVSLTVTDANGSDSQTLSNFLTVTTECDPDTIPGNSLLMATSGDYAVIPPLNINSNTLTFSAWIKPTGVQPDYTGIVMHSGSGAGLNFRPGMALAYHWPGGQWWWNSGLIVPQNEWSHVALVVTPTSVTVYLNGVGATQNITAGMVNFDVPTDIGSYHGWASRNMTGEIDEVCIWDRALSQAEIREQRHLTKKPSADPNLIAYYQFNRPIGEITDRSKIFHASLSGNATRAISSGPFGGGKSNRMTVTTGGTKNFAGTGLTIDFPAIGSYPNGELVVSRINLAPDTPPNGDPTSRSYWIVNNYGLNATFTNLSQMYFANAGWVAPADAGIPSVFKLYKRNDNADGATWGGSIDDADGAVAGNDGDISFSTGLPVTNFSQFIITTGSPTSFPIEWLGFSATLLDNKSVQLDWKTATENGNSHFEIERSLDGKNFDFMASLTSKGDAQTAQSYQSFDYEPGTGLNFYRIKQVDLNGEFSFSNIETVHLERNGLISLFPNPVASGNEMNFTFSEKGNFLLEVFDNTGRKVYSQKGESHLQLNTKEWAAGNYYYRMAHPLKMATGTIVVQ